MKCFQLALAAKNWSNAAENHWRRQMRIFRMFSLDCPRWTCEIDPSFLPNVPFVDRAAKTSIPMTFYNPVSFLIQNRVTKLSMLSLVFSRFPTSSNCLWSNDKRWWYSPHHHSRQSGAQSTFCKWLSLHTNTHRHALTHTRRQWLVCEVIICACQVAGLEFITPHSGLISPDATASSPSLFLRWPPSLSRPDMETKSILLLLISTDDRVAQVETTTLSLDATDLHPRLKLSVFMKLRGPLQCKMNFADNF